MKKIFLMSVMLFAIASLTSCTSHDVKGISGTLVFKDIGSHVFNINADNIEATITMVGPNNGEFMVFENVSLMRTADYTAKIGPSTKTSAKTEFLNNLVVMYEARSGEGFGKNIAITTETGFVKIDWKGFN